MKIEIWRSRDGCKAHVPDGGDTVSMKECLKCEAVFSVRSLLLRRSPPSLVVESRAVMARHQIFLWHFILISGGDSIWHLDSRDHTSSTTKMTRRQGQMWNLESYFDKTCYCFLNHKPYAMNFTSTCEICSLFFFFLIISRKKKCQLVIYDN